MKNSIMLFALFAVLLLTVTGCNTSTSVAGGATTVESPYVMLMVLDEKSKPVADAVVELIPSTYDPYRDSLTVIRKAYSDKFGMVRFENVGLQKLMVLIRNGSTGAYVSAISKNDTVTIELQTVSTVTIPMNSNLPARFLGSSLVGVYDSVARVNFIESVPAGLYESLVIGDQAEIVVDSVRVEPGSSPIIDIQNSGFTIEQLDVPMALIKGEPRLVSACGSRLWIGTLTAGLWYQDSIGWHQVDLSAPEFAPFRNIPIKKMSSSGAVPSGMNSELVVAVTDSGSLIYKNGTWTVLETEYLPSMKGIVVSSVSVDSSGMILIAYSNALQRFDPATNRWNSETGLSGASYVLAGTPAYVGFSNGTIKRVTDFTYISSAIMGVQGGWPINDLCTTKSGLLYAGVENGLYSVTDSQNSRVISTTVPVIDVESGPSETVWALTNDGVISVQNGDSTVVLRDFGGIFRSKDISVDSHGTLYTCGVNGIVKITHR